MARTTKKKEAAAVETAAPKTRAEKKDATKNLIRETLAIAPQKHNDLIDLVAKLYVERYEAESDNINDVKGRVGSVLDIMKKESDVMYDGGMYALKARVMPAPVEVIPEEAPASAAEVAVESAAAEEKPAPKKRGRKPKAKVEPVLEEVKEETPAVEVVVEPAAAEEKPAPKKRGRKPKAKVEPTVEVAPIMEVKEAIEEANEVPMSVATEEIPAPMAEVTFEDLVNGVPSVEAVSEEKTAEIPVQENKEEPTQLVIKENAQIREIKPVMDMSFLFGNTKPAPKAEVKAQQKQEEKKPTEKKATRQEVKTPVKAEERPARSEEKKPAPKVEEKLIIKPVKQESKQPEKTENEGTKAQSNVRKLPQGSTVRRGSRTVTAKPLTAEEKLKESFLKKVRSLGGDYFEYYSVYLLEKYSRKNGRRLEGLRISGGDHDGGIDGEIELTDKLGFKETIYIQSKNWNPEKGDERLWVVGETLLQQFIGACACRQAKDGKQNCRGIFITTSRFTPEAKHILDTMSDKIVGYDGSDLFEAAKECEFGLVKKNGQWALDENLLSGPKAFFNL